MRYTRKATQGMADKKLDASVAELVDALDLGSSARKGVGVRVPPLAPQKGVTMKQCEPEMVNNQLNFSFAQEKPTFAFLSIIVPTSFVNTLYKFAAYDQKNILCTIGFNKGEIPLEYIEQNFMHTLTEHVQEFLFKYFVLPFLYKEIHTRKLLIAGEPRLNSISVAYNAQAVFDFELSLFEHVPLQDWKYFPFKAPKRKKYKDLDRQVDSFIKEERELEKLFNGQDIIHKNDWVFFLIEPSTTDQQPIFEHEPLSLWLKMGDEDADEDIRAVFLKRSKGESFYSNNVGLQQFFGNHFETRYTFHITIVDILHDNYFCFELFKKQFKLKTNKEMLQKLIEVFSYRNNMSQRRAMVEEALGLLLYKHKFNIPKHIILRQQERLLEALAHNPDFHVYRVQKDFNDRVLQLAEKQVKETLILDQIAYNENLIPSDLDIKSYLNLTKRARSKEFVYFDVPITRINGKELPISAEEIRHICLQEKTINHIIHHLTKV